MQFLDIPKGQCEPGIEPDRVADDFWREAAAYRRYRSDPMMLIGDEPQSYPSYRDIAHRDVADVRVGTKRTFWSSQCASTYTGARRFDRSELAMGWDKA